MGSSTGAPPRERHFLAIMQTLVFEKDMRLNDLG